MMKESEQEMGLLEDCLYESKFGRIIRANDETLLVVATESYIPIEEFKNLFQNAGKQISSERYTKLVFDKRALKVFHQPSMVWYFVEWKEEMYSKGLTKHRKILPRDPVFRECVKLGRENLSKENPSAKYHEMDIQYKNSIQEAIDS